VLGDSATDDDYDAVRSAITEQQSIQSAFRLAFSRYAQRFDSDSGSRASAENGVLSAQAPLVPRHAERGADTAVEISSELRTEINRYCVACHDEGGPEFSPNNESIGGAFNFRGDELPRALVVRMADQLAYGNMPQEPISLSREQRTELVSRLIAALWEDDDAREEAAAYYLGQVRALPAHQIDNVFDLISAETGSSSTSAGWGLLERAINSDEFTYTPNYAATTALHALEGCVDAGRAGGEELEACLEAAISIDRLTRDAIE
jgi:hypothetical protein